MTHAVFYIRLSEWISNSLDFMLLVNFTSQQHTQRTHYFTLIEKWRRFSDIYLNERLKAYVEREDKDCEYCVLSTSQLQTPLTPTRLYYTNKTTSCQSRRQLHTYRVLLSSTHYMLWIECRAKNIIHSLSTFYRRTWRIKRSESRKFIFHNNILNITTTHNYIRIVNSLT